MSVNQNPLKLIQFKAESFAKIDKESPVIIVFPDGVGAYASLQGDQATGKTSGLEAFKAACGLPLPDNAVNRKDGDRRVTFEFEKGDRKYKVSITKTRFEIHFLVDGDWASLGTPKAQLGKLLGAVGVTPMFLKSMDGKKQIEWLRSFYQLGESDLKMEQEIEKELELSYNSRRAVKKDLTRVEEQLKNNKYYVDREGWQQRIENFEATFDANRIKDVQERHADYIKAKSGVERIEERIGKYETDVVNLEDEIIELERQIEVKREGQRTIKAYLEVEENRRKEGLKYLLDNKGVVEESANIAQLAVEQNEMAGHKANFKLMEKLAAESNHYHSEYIRLENVLDAWRAAKRKFITDITPDVPGLEVIVPDDKEKREGLFYNGVAPVELSESELWGLYSQLLEKQNIKIIFIENIPSLGSGAMELFERFIENGGYIIASEMKREEKQLKVIVQNKIYEDAKVEEA